MKSILIPTWLVVFSPLLDAATTYTYDFTSTFTNFQALNTDGWNDASGNWVAGTYSVPTFGRYARNQTGGDSLIYRANDANFGFTIPAGTPRIILTITARAPAFWEAGLAEGSTRRLGIGGDFGDNNKFYIFDNFSRREEVGASATVDEFTTLSLDFDLVARTADLILDPEGANTLLIDDVAMGVGIGAVEGANTLYVRSTAAFSGASKITLTVIPEPASLTLGGLGALALLRRRQRR